MTMNLTICGACHEIKKAQPEQPFSDKTCGSFTGKGGQDKKCGNEKKHSHKKRLVGSHKQRGELFQTFRPAVRCNTSFREPRRLLQGDAELQDLYENWGGYLCTRERPAIHSLMK